MMNKDWLFTSEEYICDLRTVAVLVRDGKILVQRERNGNQYALPGGHVKIGETLEDGLRRETLEEMGVRIECKKILWSEECFWDWNGKQAHSDVIFTSEEEPLSMEEYMKLRELALKSASDFLKLYETIPDKNASVLLMRKTFYGDVPRTAEEMYLHTKNVNNYYFGEIGIEADNEGTIYEGRKRGFERLERTPDFLCGRLQEGSYGEMWSVRKVLRRFIWHDRIHAKAMWKMAKKTFSESEIENVFFFAEK